MVPFLGGQHSSCLGRMEHGGDESAMNAKQLFGLFTRMRGIGILGTARQTKESWASCLFLVLLLKRSAFVESQGYVYRLHHRRKRPFGWLRRAVVHRQIGYLQADEAVVGFKRYFSELLHHSEFDLLVAPPPEGALRARLVGDPFVGAPQHQNLN
jgi:hypothetical protein